MGLAFFQTVSSADGLPRVWMAYDGNPNDLLFETDVADLMAHGVGAMSIPRATLKTNVLAIARKTGMKFFTELPDVAKNPAMIRKAGLQPVDAVMIGGAYRGLALDRHLFAFAAKPQRIIVEPPVVTMRPPADAARKPVNVAQGIWPHYYPGAKKPLRAEIVVPLKFFDGKQHLRIIPAAIEPAGEGERPENDTALPAWAEFPEVRQRQLYALSFDLTGLEKACLDKIGIAIYWNYPATPNMSFCSIGFGYTSVFAESTREAFRRVTHDHLSCWTAANGGFFPSDVLIAVRAGDELFNVTGGGIDSPATSFPLWDYSAPAVAAFRKEIGDGVDYPRTWGYPEIYGVDTYAVWLHNFHRAAAEYLAAAKGVLTREAPGCRLFRNTTRAGAFSEMNDHDGTGQEELARVLDFVHLDPYPVTAKSYGQTIMIDMSYCSGLARRYHKPLIPWMQAHMFGGAHGLCHVSPEDIDRMGAEQRAQGPDAVMWLGYGRSKEFYTFPQVRPDSWERAGAFNRDFRDHPPSKPIVRLAVLRPYRAWALSTPVAGGFRNPADKLLQAFLAVWTTEFHQPYDIFEIPPNEPPDLRDARTRELSRYKHIVSLMPYPGAKVIGEGTEGRVMNDKEIGVIKSGYRKEIKEKYLDL